MNERNWEYKGLQLSNRTKLYNFQILDVPQKITYASDVFNNRNNNGAYTTNVTAGARVFLFKGIIYGTKAEKEEAYKQLKAIIKTEDFPGIQNKGFYTLNWTDKRGINVTTSAKVYQPLLTEEGRNESLEFEFTLLSENNFYLSQVEKTINWGVGLLWGNILPNILPNNLFGGSDYIEVTNDGDYKAWLYISVIGELLNPRITNITTGQTMKIAGTTNNLIVDNRKKPFLITDGGVNIKAQQTGQFIYLVAGLNKIVVSCENYTGNDQADVYIKYNDTYE